jgi:hypothetical protein
MTDQTDNIHGTQSGNTTPAREVSSKLGKALGQDDKAANDPDYLKMLGMQMEGKQFNIFIAK